MSPDEHPTSPRLTKLMQDLEKGDRGILENFWQEVQTNTSPLIEPIEGDDHSLVTFLWRAEEKLNGVSVISLITGLEDNKMTRMLETDLWYTTRRVKNDLRATYQLEPHRVDDVPAEGDNYEARIARFSRLKPDPFNPHTFIFEKDPEDPEGFELVRSVLEMPEAPVQPWIEEREDVPKGRVELHRFRSDILDNERRVWVYTPPGYSPDDGREYGLIVLFDGKSYVEMVPTPTILDNLTAAGRIEPMVAVIPDSLGMMTRIQELILNEDFNRFLVEELVPWVRENWSVTRDPSRVVVGGASAGGLAAAYVAFEHPEVFGNVLSQSGAFSFGKPGEEGFEWLTDQIASRERVSVRFYLDAGSLETKSLRPIGDAPNLIAANHKLQDVLKEKGYFVHYHEFSGGHDYVSWQGRFGEALLILLD